jgi:hypothetical protein
MTRRRPVTSPPWQVRVATKADRALLRGFSCATDHDEPWAREVDSHIQNDLLNWSLEKGAAADEPTIVLVFDTASGDLVGVAAHERQSLGTNALDKVDATKIHLAAVAKKWQGKTFSTGERVSHIVMNAADIATHVPPRDPRIFAIVHRANARSVALCKRFGLVKRLRSDHADYVIFATEHATAK